MDPGRSVDPVADDEAFLGRPGRSSLPGHDSDPGGELEVRVLGAEGGDCGHELEPCADGSLGIVLLCRRHAPDRHHGVADELLDDTAVAGDDAAGEVEIAREKFPHLLRITGLGERREADEVAEQDRHETKLGQYLSGRRLIAPGPRRRSRARRVRPGREPVISGRRLDQRRAAFAAELGGGKNGRAAARADPCEWVSALVTEFGTLQVLDPAVGADHRVLL